MYSAGAAPAPQNRTWAARTLPVSDEQSCIVGGSSDWAWLFPLEPATERGFAFGPFLCTCDEHRGVLAAQEPDEVAVAFAGLADGDSAVAQRYATAFFEDRLGPPLSRRIAIGG